MSTADPETPYTPGMKKETQDYLTPDFVPAERQDTRTSVVAAIGGGLPADPLEVDPPRESLRGCVVLLGCVLIASKSSPFDSSSRIRALLTGMAFLKRVTWGKLFLPRFFSHLTGPPRLIPPSLIGSECP